jgi:hypothetical protein
MAGHACGPPAVAPSARSSELLGFPPDARVLIVNSDDFGMYQAVNAAVLRSIVEGIASSCSLMVPCPAARHAMHLLGQHPQIPFGIHLTLLCDTTHHRWGPLTAKQKVPSLLDETGQLFTPAEVPACLPGPASTRWSLSSVRRSTPWQRRPDAHPPGLALPSRRRAPRHLRPDIGAGPRA